MRILILLTLVFSSSLFAQSNVNNPRCDMAEAQLKRVQSFLKNGEKEKWGRNLVEYQNELFAEVDKQCFPDSGVAASLKSKKVIKKESQASRLIVDNNAPHPKKGKKVQTSFGENQVAEIGPAGSISKRPSLTPQLSPKAKAWAAWYTPAPECSGRLEIDMFVYCNKLEKAQKAEFEKLWQTRNKKE